MNETIGLHQGSDSFKGRTAIKWNSALPVIALIGLYALAWGGIFLSGNSVYWDDWVLVEPSSDDVIATFHSNGFPLYGYGHVFLLNFGPFVYHALTWGAFLIAGISLYGILQKLNCVETWQRFLITALFLVLPINAARFAMINIWYAVGIAAFFLAWFILVRRTPPRLTSELISVVMFLVSFMTQSLLVFYLLPLVMFAHQLRKIGWEFRAIIVRYGYCLFLPVAFYAFKSIFWRVDAAGPYEGYNSLSAKGLVLGGLLLLCASLPLIAILSRRKRLEGNAQKLLQTWLLFFAGVFVAVLALFPYIAVGYVPPFREWGTRHYLLFPLGLALIITAVISMIRLVLSPKAGTIVASIMIVIAVIGSIGISASYYVDWKKQEMIMEYLAKDENMKNCDLIYFDDNTLQNNLFGAPWAFYSWNGLMTRSLGNSARFGVPFSGQIQSVQEGEFALTYGETSLDYNARNFTNSQGLATVTINYVSPPPISSSLAGQFQRSALYTGIWPMPVLEADEIVWESKCELE